MFFQLNSLFILCNYSAMYLVAYHDKYLNAEDIILPVGTNTGDYLLVVKKENATATGSYKLSYNLPSSVYHKLNTNLYIDDDKTIYNVTNGNDLIEILSTNDQNVQSRFLLSYNDTDKRYYTDSSYENNSILVAIYPQNTTSDLSVIFFGTASGGLISNYDVTAVACLPYETTVSTSGNNYVLSTPSYTKYLLRNGTYLLKNIPSTNPIAILNNGISGINYSGLTNASKSSKTVDGKSYNFYYGTVTVNVMGILDLFLFITGMVINKQISDIT